MRIYNEKLKIYYETQFSTKNKEEYILMQAISSYNLLKSNDILNICNKIGLLARYIDGYEIVEETKLDKPRENYTKIETRKSPKKNVDLINKQFNKKLKKITKLLFNDKQVIEAVEKLNKPKEIVKNDYLKYLRTKKWKILKNKILKRDNNECKICNKTTNLECHHITYKNIFNEKDEDLITLCKGCHTEEHNKIKQQNKTVDEYYSIQKNKLF